MHNKITQWSVGSFTINTVSNFLVSFFLTNPVSKCISQWKPKMQACIEKKNKKKTTIVKVDFWVSHKDIEDRVCKKNIECGQDLTHYFWTNYWKKITLRTESYICIKKVGNSFWSTENRIRFCALFHVYKAY